MPPPPDDPKNNGFDYFFGYLSMWHAHNYYPDFLYRNSRKVPHANNEASRFDAHGMEVPDLGPYGDKDWPEPEKAKAAMISRLDADVGRILSALEELKIADNTLVIFSSDIAEQHNIADRHPETIEKMTRILNTARTNQTTWPLRGEYI